MLILYSLLALSLCRKVTIKPEGIVTMDIIHQVYTMKIVDQTSFYRGFID